jgi:hypothetical protein
MTDRVIKQLSTQRMIRVVKRGRRNGAYPGY